MDLVVLFAQPTSYLKELQDRIMETLFGIGGTGLDRPGGVFLRNVESLDAETLLMLRATARLHPPVRWAVARRISTSVIMAAGSRLRRPRVACGTAAGPRAPARAPVRPRALDAHRSPVPALGDSPQQEPAGRPPAAVAAARPAGRHVEPDGAGLTVRQRTGGLDATGDYVIRVAGDAVPPAPWVNVVAHERGGFIVSERGAGCTWAENSYFFRLTPWHNDPVSDPISDVLYLQDEASGDTWSATPAPLGHDTEYTVRHRAGASVFEAERNGIATRLTLGMADDEPVRLSVLRVTNRDAVERRIRLTAYVEWTLGAQREHTQHHVHTAFEPELGAVFARNHFDPQFNEHVAFCALSEPVTGHTGGSPRVPRTERERAGARRTPGPRSLGARPAPVSTRAPRSSASSCLLPASPARWSCPSARPALRRKHADVVTRFRSLDDAKAAAGRTVEQWRRRLSVITVRTPDPAFDALLNRWLPVPDAEPAECGRDPLSTRAAAPTASATSSRTSLAVVHAEPALARGHILRAAARQFLEGDVQHWWHPHTGAGVRTRFSDDLAWLPWVVDEYVTRTGDASVLDEYVPFLTMRPLEPGEDEIYDLPGISDEHGSVYEHCLRALRRACTSGAPRPAPDRHGRLERRDEPGRRGGARGERMARVVPHRDPALVRHARRGARR